MPKNIEDNGIYKYLSKGEALLGILGIRDDQQNNFWDEGYLTK